MNIAATYDYLDPMGALLYQVVRLDPKDFRARRPVAQQDATARGQAWIWDIDGVELVPYRLPEILAKPDHPVIVVEGEKDADALAKIGLQATTSPFGAGKWPMVFGSYFSTRRVAIIPDNDEPGWKHAALVAGSLFLYRCPSVRIVDLGGREGEDVSDWLADRLPRTTDQMLRKTLSAIIRATPEYRSHLATPQEKAA
jgi:putative DNA primase/helicase